MNQPQDLPALIIRLRDILTAQVRPLNASTSSNIHVPVLPPKISPLPQSALTLPDHSSSPLDTLTPLLASHILPYLNLSSLSPNYYGFVTGGATPAALLADWLASVYDQSLSVHLPAETIATNVEVAALNLLVELFNLPTSTWGIAGNGISTGNGSGTLTTGATASNVLGLAIGREWIIREAGRRNGTTHEDDVSIGSKGFLRACRNAKVNSIHILSTMPHSSIAKAASILGLGRDSIIPIGHDSNPLRIDLSRLESLAQTMHTEQRAYILAISTGEVNTGLFATDGMSTMTQLRTICDQAGIWIHVDGAFGLFGRVLMNSGAEYTHLARGVEGIELADSITGDGHKLLNVPYDCGLFFTRHKRLSEAVFQNGNAAYLVSGMGEDDGVQSPMNLGIENSRRFRALPVWATLMAYGRRGYVDMLTRQVGLARRVVQWMCGLDGVEVLPECASVEEAVARTYMVVLFRARDEAVNAGLVKRINATGRMYVTGTRWDGRPAARIAVSNWQVDVERDSALIKEVISECIA